ncbi:MAG: MBL fold metallo-hydrolase [bacterium]|nr:MBL fold metallo-hydrolase [bacterium]
MPDSVLTDLTFHNAGHCRQSEYFTGSGSFKSRQFEAVVARIEHPQHGVALIDTGYSPHYFEVTKRLPERLIQWLLPVAPMPAVSAQQRWRDRGIDLKQIDHIFVSHFHADHIGALVDFKATLFFYRSESLKNLKRMNRVFQLHQGFFEKLLPTDFEEQGEPIAEPSFIDQPIDDYDGDEAFPFRWYDFWGDGSLLLIDLPGHALGHTGYLIRLADRTVFYIVDASWNLAVSLAGGSPPWLGRQVQHDSTAYLKTLAQIRKIAERTSWEIVACHCPLTQERGDHVGGNTP